MEKINNAMFKKGIKKINNYLYAFIILICLSAFFIAIGIKENKEKDNNFTYLNDVIETKNNEENVNAYLDITDTPYSIAKYENEENYAFYIVFDDRYFYIAYLSNDLYNHLNVENLSDNPIRIYGTTTKIPDDVKNIALEVYNEGLDEENQIEMEDFNSYFGEVYLDNTSLQKTDKSFYIISIFPLAASLIILTTFIIKKIKIKKIIHSLSEDELKKIEKEIEDEKTINYSKYHLILTPNYLITFNQGLNILNYQDLIWIYENRIRQYGITTAVNVFIMNNKGKTINILSTDGLTKKGKSISKEIISNISSKNENILIGFNKKNKEEIKNILKNS